MDGSSESDVYMSHYSNAIVENWMRIVKIDILKSRTGLRPGDLIRIMHPNIIKRLAAFCFAFHPRAAKKVFKSYKRKRDPSEEENCQEEWQRRSKKKCNSYLVSKSISFSQVRPLVNNKNKIKLDAGNDINETEKKKCKISADKNKKTKLKFVPRLRQRLSDLKKRDFSVSRISDNIDSNAVDIITD